MARHLLGRRFVAPSEGGQSMNLTSSRRADEFNRLLESGTRTDDPVAGPLLAVADALSAVPGVEGPRPEFRAALRQRLVAVATVQGVGAPAESSLTRARAATGTWRVQRRLTALAAGAAVITGVTGVALGATRSLPGDPFYGVKRAAEGAQLATTVGTEPRGKRHLEFARTRLTEVEELAGTSAALAPAGDGAFIAAGGDQSGTAKLIVDTLHDMDVQTRDGANDLFAAYRDSGSIEPLRALDRFTQDQYRRLQTLLPELPASAQPSARSSLALLSVIATDTVRAATGSAPQQPGATTTPASPGPSAGTNPKPGPSASGPSSAPSSTPATSGSGSTKNVTPLPTSLPTAPAPLPSLPTIPPLPTTSPLPTSVPTLPSDITGLLGN
jgi:hypothetical protein